MIHLAELIVAGVIVLATGCVALLALMFAVMWSGMQVQNAFKKVRRRVTS